MKFAGYDHRFRAKVPCIGTKVAEWWSIVAGRYTLQAFDDQLSVECVCFAASCD